jgi:hypothetical protein
MNHRLPFPLPTSVAKRIQELNAQNAEVKNRRAGLGCKITCEECRETGCPGNELFGHPLAKLVEKKGATR